MLLNLPILARKFNLKIKGVIHVGAHYGEEVANYHAMGIHDIVLIEPCQKAFHHLRSRFEAHKHIRLINVACGSSSGMATMYTETANKGQSNSLLEPGDHLQQYPDIKFTGTEQVDLLPLDSLALGPKYNFINSDCQGYEGEVYRGAIETLRHVDYIYTEVNRTEVYKGCTQVGDLDTLLADFKRVETGSWVNNSWTDALYIKKSLL